MKGFKKTIFLFLILVGLSVWYYFYEIKGGEKREKIKSIQKRVFLIPEDKVSFLGIYSGEKSIECGKEKDKWMIEKPEKLDGDKEEIENVIKTVIELEKEREIGEVENLNSFGLEKPVKKIVVGEDGKRYMVFIGDENPSGSYYYATSDRKKVFLISKWDVDDVLKKKVFDLRDKRIIPAEIEKEKIEKIEVKRKKLKFVCKREKERWNLVYPVSDWADETKVEDIVDEIIDGKIKSFEKEKKSLTFYKLKKPEIEIKIECSGKTYSLFIGKKQDGLYYAKNSLKPYIFSIDKSVVETLPEKLIDIRDRDVFKFNSSDVKEITVERGKEKFTLLKEKEEWKVKEKKEKISSQKVEDFLDDLKFLEIEGFLKFSPEKLSQYNLSPPLVKITVKTEKEKEEILFGKKTKDKLYSYNPERKIIFYIPASDSKIIEKELKDFVEEKEESKESE